MNENVGITSSELLPWSDKTPFKPREANHYFDIATKLESDGRWWWALMLSNTVLQTGMVAEKIPGSPYWKHVPLLADADRQKVQATALLCVADAMQKWASDLISRKENLFGPNDMEGYIFLQIYAKSDSDPMQALSGVEHYSIYSSDTCSFTTAEGSSDLKDKTFELLLAHDRKLGISV